MADNSPSDVNIANGRYVTVYDMAIGICQMLYSMEECGYELYTDMMLSASDANLIF